MLVEHCICETNSTHNKNFSILPYLFCNLHFFYSTEPQSSTPCSDSGNSSPGVVEDDPHSHQQPIAHPLLRHTEANSYQTRNGHRYSPTDRDNQYRNTSNNKRHRSVGDLDDCSDRSPKRLASVEDVRMESHVQYLMQQRMAAIHGAAAKHQSTPESHQRLSERDSQLIFHHHADIIARQQSENSRMPSTYPIPNGLSFLEANRHRGLYFGGEVNGALFHEEETDHVDDDIFASGEKASGITCITTLISSKYEKYRRAS